MTTADSSYKTLYRRYRPETFSQVVGQDHIVGTLARSLESNRLAHAYLFTGPRGTGKTTTARILAKALNCESGPTASPCLTCRHCVDIGSGRHIDIFEIDAASNRGIDEIRALRERAIYAPAEARRKVYIVDEVHMLTNEAFNALLKLLEEPPSHVLFVLATTEPHKVPKTIESRCQQFDFRPLSVTDLAGHLREVAGKEGIDAEEGAFEEIARASDGGARDALAALEQLSAFCSNKVTVADITALLGGSPFAEILSGADTLIEGSPAGILALVEGLEGSGRDLRDFAERLADHLKLLLLVGLDQKSAVDGLPAESRERLLAQATKIEPSKALIWMESLARSSREMRDSRRARLELEVALLAMGCGVPNGSAGSEDSTQKEFSTLRSKVAALEAGLRALQSSLEAGTLGTAAGRHSSGMLGTSRSGLNISAPAPRPAASAKPEPKPAVERTVEERSTPEKGAPTAAEQAITKGPPSSEGLTGGGSTENPNGGKEQHHGFDGIKKLWPDILREVRSKRIATYALLLEAQPVDLSESTLTLRFGPKAAFHRGEMDKPANSSLLYDALRKTLGYLPEVQCVVGEGVPEVSPSDAVEDRALEGEALVAAIKERFSAQIVD